jgi:peptidoglycan-associated lipoprotein
MSMKKFVLVMGAALLMAGCGSAVKLDNTPVEDRSTGATVATDSGAVAKGGVTPVDAGKSQQGAIPAGSRVVYFDYDSYVVKPEFQSVIEAQASFIKSEKGRKVVIEGHTDERGGREYNLALGQKRAEAVRRALGLLGVADSQLEAVSFGKEKPVVQGSDESAWSKNRRAEISYR